MTAEYGSTRISRHPNDDNIDEHANHLDEPIDAAVAVSRDQNIEILDSRRLGSSFKEETLDSDRLHKQS
jgi:hypothetical protein